jgi:hypothetical protein
MIPKSGDRFSEEIMLPKSMISKSGDRFSEEIMLPKSMISKSGDRFSEEIMLPKSMIPKSGTGFRKRSCSNKKVERDDNLMKSHPARAASHAPVRHCRSPRKTV